MELSDEAREILHDVNTKCDECQRWIDVNQKRFNDLMTSQSGTDDNVTSLEKIIEDCDIMIGKCDELFAKCANFNVVARNYDVTVNNDDSYQRKCNQRMTAVQKRVITFYHTKINF